MKKLIPFLLLATACGDNNDTPTPDAAPADAAPDAPPFVAPTPIAVPISSAGNDQLLGAVAASSGGGAGGGGFYAVGFRAPTHEATADRELVLVKVNGMGALDTTFGGGDGIATLNVQVGGAGEVWRGIVVQPSGKIVVSGVVEDQTVAADRDVALVRFNADGTVDNSFGVDNNGIVRLELNVAILNTATPPALTGQDATWALAVDSAGKLYVHASQRTATLDANNMDTLTDTDFAAIRLTVDGALDNTFDGDGKFLLDIQRSSANARGINVLADGSVIVSGYAKSASLGAGSDVQPVLFKLTSAGALDTNFGSGGLFHEAVMAYFTEVYGIAVQPDGKLVTAGYGRNDMSATNDWVSIRFTAAGAIDTTWGTGGKYVLDPTGMNVADNNRNIINLNNGRVALIGSGGPVNATSDGYIVVLDNTGKPDTAFGTGIMKFDLGSNDAFWGGALTSNGNRAMFVGFKGGGATPSATSNDDAYVIPLSLQ